MARLVLNGDATRLPLRDEMVATVVTSPPYNVGIVNESGLAEYSDDLLAWEDYEDLATLSAVEMDRVLEPGGRVWINIQAVVPKTPGSKERVNLAQIWEFALEAAGLQYRDTIAWVQDSHDGGCAWGSWAMPSAPNLRGGHELILLYYKPHPSTPDGWRRPTPARWKGWRDASSLGGDLPDLYRNVWKIRPARSKYKATYPIELAARCIRLSTWPDEVVLDPFVGTGTTLLAAEALASENRVERMSIGVERSRTMCAEAKERL